MDPVKASGKRLNAPVNASGPFKHHRHQFRRISAGRFTPREELLQGDSLGPEFHLRHVAVRDTEFRSQPALTQTTSETRLGKDGTDPFRSGPRDSPAHQASIPLIMLLVKHRRNIVETLPDGRRVVVKMCRRCEAENRLVERGGSGRYVCGKCGEPIANPFSTKPVASAHRGGQRRWGPIALVASVAFAALMIGIAVNQPKKPPTEELESESAELEGSPGLTEPQDRVQLEPRPTPKPAPEPPPVERWRPTSGTVLYDGRGSDAFEYGTQLDVDNGTDADALLKLVPVGSSKKLLSFFVARKSKCSITGIPPGTYRLLFALGDGLDAETGGLLDCTSRSEFEEPLQFEETRSPAGTSSTQIVAELAETFGGNARTSPVDPREFDGF